MRRLISVFAVTGLILAVGVGCKEQGPMEKAGEAVDEAVEDMKDVGQGPMEKAGESADEAVDKTKEAVEGEK